jgi:hypothetical protein
MRLSNLVANTICKTPSCDLQSIRARPGCRYECLNVSPERLTGVPPANHSTGQASRDRIQDVVQRSQRPHCLLIGLYAIALTLASKQEVYYVTTKIHVYQ